jgi:hypothetical protein
MKVLLAAVLATASLLSSQLHTGGLSQGEGKETFTGVKVWKHRSDPKMVSLPDCEDVDQTPCITYDSGSWRRVTSYEPYTATKVVPCGQEDGGPVLPCVWTKHKNLRTNGWNYFTK